MIQRTLLLFALVSLGLVNAFAEKGFQWKEDAGKHVDLLKDGKKIARYVYERMDPKDRERTYKPFHHVYQANGKDFLTKGPGGKYTHHRGIYFGFSKCTAQDSHHVIVIEPGRHRDHAPLVFRQTVL